MASLLISLATLSLVCVSAQRSDRNHTTLVGPHDILPTLDCSIRALALNFSQVLIPWADSSLVSDALRLSLDCPSTAFSSAPTLPKARTGGVLPLGTGAATFYADPINGKDSNTGTITSPFATISRALLASRAAAPTPATIILRGGTFWLPSTIELGVIDSGLTLSAYPGETPIVSGGTPLAGLTWRTAPPQPPPPPPPPINGPFEGSILAEGNGGCVDGPGKTNPGVCAPLGQFPAVAACSAACVNSTTCTGYTWHDSHQGDFAQWCYARLDGYQTLAGASGHFSGWKSGATPPTSLNIWEATLPPTVQPFDQLFMFGRRLQRARWPNANAETQQHPVGFSGGARYLAPNPFPAPTETDIPNLRPDSKDFPNFQWGFGGTVENFTTGSFWGTKSPPAGGQYTVPSGMDITGVHGAVTPSNWTRVSQAIVHIFQGGNWGDWAFQLQGQVQNDTTLLFSRGGWQEARGGGGNEFYFENIPELLDSAGEWYYNTDTQVLSIAFNGTSALGNETLVAAQLEELVRVTGTSSAPVTGVTLTGLTFAHTLTDYMLPYTVPSGGDWSFHDGGMVRLSGTAGVSIQSCFFSAPGGNGLMVSGFNRGTSVKDSEFAWTGSSGIVSAGLGGFLYNASTPEYPEGMLVEGTLGREIGVYVKQSGFFYAGVSANFTLRGNVVFNAARAAININDGFAGGHLLEKNLLFNAVRETNDHGPINSWDRIVYSEPQLPMHITRNFVINNYNSVWGLCHDDGSNSFLDTYNFLPWSGTKNYLGYNKTSIGNWFVYSDLAGLAFPEKRGLSSGWSTCSMSYGGWPMGALQDVWSNNTCITQGVGRAQFSFDDCNSDDPIDGHVPLFSMNTYSNPSQGYAFPCGKNKSVLNLAQAQAAGQDIGSVVVPIISDEDILAAGHALLEF